MDVLSVGARLNELTAQVRNLQRERGPRPLNMRDLRDASLSQVEDGQVPVYDKATGRWLAGNGIEFGATVVAETAFAGTVPAIGAGELAARSTHTHGTPLPRHPQTGFPYVSFANGQVVVGFSSTDNFGGILYSDHDPSFRGGPAGARLGLTSPIKNNGTSGRGVVDVRGNDNGDGVVAMYNDLADGVYGPTGETTSPFRLELAGTLHFRSIDDTPAVAPLGTARIYYKSSTGKLQVSQSGSAYSDLMGDADLGYGAVGTVLKTTGANSRAWTANTEFVISGGNVGIGRADPQSLLHVSGGDIRVDYPYGLRLGANQTVHDGGNGSTIVRGDSVVLSSNPGGISCMPTGTGRVGVGKPPSAGGRMLQVLGEIEASEYVHSGVAKGFLVQGANSDPAAGWFVADANPAYKITADGASTAARRTLLIAPYAAAGWGRAVAEMASFADGTCQLHCYNDLDIDGGYGGTGATPQPFAMRIEGGNQNTLTHQTAVLQVDTTTSRVGVSLRASTVANVIRVQTDVAGFIFKNSNDTAYVPLHASLFVVNSARESKSAIRPMQASALATVAALEPVSFDRPGPVDTRGETTGPPTRHLGLVADDVADVIPEAVAFDGGKPVGIDYAAITATLVKAMQEQSGELDSLRQQVLALAGAR